MRLLTVVVILLLTIRCTTEAITAHYYPIKASKPTDPAIKVAVIDTGFGHGSYNLEKNVKLCKYGHRDFTHGSVSSQFNTVTPVPTDSLGHGTNIAGIIDQYASKHKSNYCLVILKYTDGDSTKAEDTLANEVAAIRYATDIHAQIINNSNVGHEYSVEEDMAVRLYIDHGGVFVNAAGNDGSDLSKYPTYPTVNDNRIIVVGNGLSENNKSWTSNYGKSINIWENGQNISACGVSLSGTSQSTAIVTGKYVWGM